MLDLNQGVWVQASLGYGGSLAPGTYPPGFSAFLLSFAAFSLALHLMLEPRTHPACVLCTHPSGTPGRGREHGRQGVQRGQRP